MKSVVQNIKSGAILIDDIPSPVLKPGNILVRNICSLVSAGTEKAVLEFSKANYLSKARQRPDLFRKVLNKAKNEGLWQTYKVVSNLIDQPIQLGYSSAGIVEAIGSEITDIHVGQKVACAGLFVATHSEKVSVPRNLVVPIPENLDFENASFVTLGAIALQGVRLANLEIGEKVVVYGLGLVGIITAQLAVAAGCHVIGVDIDHGKTDLVERFGAAGVVAKKGFEKTVLEKCDGYGADKVLLCAATKSNEPIELIPEFTSQKGAVVVVGDVSINVPRRAYYDKEIDIRISRSYGPGRYDLSYEEGGLDYPYAYVRWTENRNMQAFIDLMARQRIDVSALITHRYDIDEAKTAYDLIENKIKESYMGVVIRYAQEDALSAVEDKIVLPALSVRKDGIGLGLIGAGNFAKAMLIPAFDKQGIANIEAICTASGVSAKTIAEKYGATLATSSSKDVIEAENVDLVVITTRHNSHAQYVLDTLKSKKAVFVEKPPCLTLEELALIKKEYEEQETLGNKPFLMVGYNRRFSPLSHSLRQALAGKSEPLAMTYRVNAGHVPSTEWVHDPEIGGGRIVGEAGHFIDLMAYLCGHNPVAVSGSVLQTPVGVTRDVTALNIEFADGSIGALQYFANGDPAMPKETLEVFCGGASARLLNFRTLKTYGLKVDGRKSFLNQVKGFEEEAAAVVSALQRGNSAPIPFELIHAVSKATLVAEHAIASGTKIRLFG